MIDFVLLPENLPFSVALIVMLMIGIAEAIGLGAGGVDLDTNADLGGHSLDLLGWLGVGRIPLLIVLVVLLAAFGVIGIGIQQLALELTGRPLSPWLAAPIALVASLPLTGLGARGLAYVLPQDESTAVGLGSLVGRRAEIVIGEARRGSPARGRVRDVHGQTHYVMIEPTGDNDILRAGATALLVRREGGLFFGLPDINPLLAPDEDPPAHTGFGG